MAKNESHPQPSPACFDFNVAVDEALRHYPHLSGTTVFVETTDGTWRGADIGANEKAALDSTLEKSRREGLSFTCLSEAFNLQAMIYTPRRENAVLFEDAQTDYQAIFDHELAHLAVRDANRRTRLHPVDESICDSFAMLRHLQRGSDNDDASRDFCGWKRAFDCINMKTATHLTSFAVDRLLTDAQERDFKALSPGDTADLARHYALQYTPDPDETLQILNAFAPLWGELGAITPDHLQPIAELGKITLRLPVSSPAFYIGNRVLSGFLKDGGAVVKGQQITLSGAKWDGLRHALHAKYKGLDKSSPLVKFGLKMN